ncbi:hypothetical protein K0B03_04295 [Patescibacteria group bacterium]|nr:hypothetical protein [Patescibacteria group bacterium]
MIKINLISSSDKLALKWKKIDRSVVNIFIVLFFIQIIVIINFLFTLYFLDIEKKNISAGMDILYLKSEAKEISLITKQTRLFENQIKTYESLEELHLNWLNILEDFINIVPDGIKIDNISIKPMVETSKTPTVRRPMQVIENKNYDKLQIIFIGKSKTMKDLLFFEENMQKSDIFSGFSVNPGNYDSSDFRYSLTRNN